MSYGAKRHDRPGTPVNLHEGQQLSGLSLRLPRGGVIAGRILDEERRTGRGRAGPAAAIPHAAGERTLMPALGGSLMGETTDDRGLYQLYGLPPGEYLVAARPRNTNAGGSALHRRGDSGGDGSAAAAGDTGPAGRPAPPAPARLRHRRVCACAFPGSPSVGGASSISLGPGEERSSVDFSLQLVRTANRRHGRGALRHGSAGRAVDDGAGRAPWDRASWE